MSEQEKRCSAYLRSWKKRKRCSYKAVNNGRCRRHQEKTVQRKATHPATDSDVVERVARAIANARRDFEGKTEYTDEEWGVDFWDWYKNADPNARLAASTYPALLDASAKAAIAAMQPAVDKAVAEERSRCAKFMRTHCVMQTPEGYEIKPVTGKLVDATNELWAKAIEQGGGDDR